MKGYEKEKKLQTPSSRINGGIAVRALSSHLGGQPRSETYINCLWWVVEGRVRENLA